MSLYYLVKHDIAICGTWKHYFHNFGDVNKVVNSGLQIPHTWIQSTTRYRGWRRIASTRLQYMMSTNWSPSGPTWSRAWSTRLLMNGAQGSQRVFVPRDNILNICFVKHEHYFFACLTVCLWNFINVAEIAKTSLCVPQIAISCFTK